MVLAGVLSDDSLSSGAAADAACASGPAMAELFSDRDPDAFGSPPMRCAPTSGMVAS
jgi:hypothetical protein